jgi:hypothetical protein
MRKIAIPFVLVWFFLVGCTEEEKPEGPYGWYYVESVSTSIPIDFTNSGQQTTEHIDSFSWCGSSPFSIAWRLNKLTPVMDFDYFSFFERENEITMEKEIFRGCGITRRIVEIKEDNQLILRWFGGKSDFTDDPRDIDFEFKVKSISYLPEEKSLRLVAQQELFDFTSEEFVEAEVVYSFKFGGQLNFPF